jgi:mycothiol synthase
MAIATVIDVADALSDAEVDDIAHLVERVTEVDGVRPLSEHVTMHLLTGHADGFRHICAFVDDRLVAYASLDLSSAVGAVVELVVDASVRTLGVGGAVLDQALRETSGRLDLWAHGEFAAAHASATSRGFRKVRTLYRMRRTLLGELPLAPVPDGIEIRAFNPVTDTDDWLALNAAAFAQLPDQGGWTRHDLEMRQREEWFDLAGFLLAQAVDTDGTSGELAGFHWTKVHRHDDAQDSADQGGHGHQPIGEVYVLGIAPAWHGRGLGRALTVVGMKHLKDQGLTEIMLYVDSANSAAIKTYERLGFVRYEKDVLFASPVPARPNQD